MIGDFFFLRLLGTVFFIFFVVVFLLIPNPVAGRFALVAGGDDWSGRDGGRQGDRRASGRDPSTGYAFQKSGRALGALLNANMGLGVRLGRWVGRASKLVARRALQFNPCSARGSV